MSSRSKSGRSLDEEATHEATHDQRHRAPTAPDSTDDQFYFNLKSSVLNFLIQDRKPRFLPAKVYSRSWQIIGTDWCLALWQGLQEAGGATRDGQVQIQELFRWRSCFVCFQWKNKTINKMLRSGRTAKPHRGENFL